MHNLSKVVEEPQVSIIVNIKSKLTNLIFLESFKKLLFSNYRVIIFYKNMGTNFEKYVKLNYPEFKLFRNIEGYTNLEILNKIIYDEINQNSDFLLFTDQNHYLYPNFLREILNSCNEDNVGIVLGKNQKSSKEKYRTRNNFLNDFISYEKDIKNGNEFYNVDSALEFPYLVRSNVIKILGPFNTFLFHNSENLEFCLRVRKQGYKIFYNSKAISKYLLLESYKEMKDANYWLIKNNYILYWCYTDRSISTFFNLLFSNFIIDLNKAPVKNIFYSILGTFSGILWLLRNGLNNKNYIDKFKLFAKEKYLKEKFEYDYGTATSEFKEHQHDQLEDLIINSPNIKDGVESGPTPLLDFGEIMGILKNIIGKSTFIDLGSGRGRAILLATEFNFKKFIGVEFSEELIQISKKNVHNFRKKSGEKREIDLLCMDAVDFDYPLGPLTLYLFNPFGTKVLSKVISKLLTSAKESPRKILLIYYNSVHNDIIESSGFFYKIHSRKNYNGKTWLDNSLPYSVYELKI